MKNLFCKTIDFILDTVIKGAVLTVGTLFFACLVMLVWNASVPLLPFVLPMLVFKSAVVISMLFMVLGFLYRCSQKFISFVVDSKVSIIEFTADFHVKKDSDTDPDQEASTSKTLI